jgi:hypothetical protein
MQAAVAARRVVIARALKDGLVLVMLCRINECVEPVTGWTCAHYAAACQSDAGARELAWLWSHKAHITTPSVAPKLLESAHIHSMPAGSTCLHVAAAVGHEGAVHVLLSIVGEDVVQQLNAAGQTARDLVQLRPLEDRAAIEEEFVLWQQRFDADGNRSGLALAIVTYLRGRSDAAKQAKGATGHRKLQLIGAALFNTSAAAASATGSEEDTQDSPGTPASEIRFVSSAATGSGTLLIAVTDQPVLLLCVHCSYASLKLVHSAAIAQLPPDSQSASSSAAAAAAAAALVGHHGASTSDEISSASLPTDVPQSLGLASVDQTAQQSDAPAEHGRLKTPGQHTQTTTLLSVRCGCDSITHSSMWLYVIVEGTDARSMSIPDAAAGMDVPASGISGKGSTSQTDSQQAAAGGQPDAAVTAAAAATNLADVAKAAEDAENASMSELLLHVREISDHVIRQGTAAWDPMFPGSLVSEWQPETLRYLMPVSLVWVYDAAEAAKREANLSLCPYQKHMPLLPMFTCSIAGDGDCAMHSVLMQVPSGQSEPAIVASARDTVLRVERTPWNGWVPIGTLDCPVLIAALARYREW